MPGPATRIVIYAVVALVIIAVIVWSRRGRLRSGAGLDARTASPAERKQPSDARLTSVNLGRDARNTSVMNAAAITGADTKATPPEDE